MAAQRTWRPEAARAWVEGQRRASRTIERERVRTLLHMTPAQSLRAYLADWQPPKARGPSPLLLAMRRTVARGSAGK